MKIPVIVHVSADYPDAMAPNKTKAVLNLVTHTPEYRHVVYSLNRVNAWSGLTAVPFGEDRMAIAYGALPKGLFWESRLRDVAKWIARDLKAKQITPNLIEAHKFTVEGLIGQALSQEFSCPFICDIQGNTDAKILARKLDLRSRYKQIAQDVSLVFSYSPWAIPTFHKLVGLPEEKCHRLPVIPGIDSFAPSEMVEDDRLVTVFHLDHWRLKNLERVIHAIEKLSKTRPAIRLDVYGGGRPESLMAIQRVIARSPVRKRIRLMGAVENGALPELLRGYAGFVMPSLSETYGLVYAEALFAGLPILFSKDRGIDGYFDANRIGYACNPHSTDDIAQGILHLLTRQASLKQSIADLQDSGDINCIRKESIVKTYRDGLQRVLAA